MTGNPEPFDRLLAAPGRLTPGVRNMLTLDRSIRTGTLAERVGSIVTAAAAARDANEFYYPVERLIALGRANDALSLLDARPGLLQLRDAGLLKLDAYAVLGWDTIRHSQIELLFQKGSSSTIVEVVAAHLIRYPNAELERLVFGELDESPLPATDENAGAHTALLCLAGESGDSLRFRQETQIFAKLSGGHSAVEGRMREFFEEPAKDRNPCVFLPALSRLPLQATYALLETYPPKRS
jgi:hypothetical protein